MYKAVRDGITQSTCFAIPYEAGTLQLPTIKELPFSFKTFENSFAMWREMEDVGLQDYFHNYGIHVVACDTQIPAGFWTTKRWGPIKRLEDIKGCKIRSSGGYRSKAMEAMGAIPVTSASPDAYAALERGALDCISIV